MGEAMEIWASGWICLIYTFVRGGVVDEQGEGETAAYKLALLKLGYGLGVYLDVVALEAAEIKLLHDAAVAGVMGRGGVDEVLVLCAVGGADVRMVLDDEVVRNGTGSVERGRRSGFAEAAEGEPGDGCGSDEIFHLVMVGGSDRKKGCKAIIGFEITRGMNDVSAMEVVIKLLTNVDKSADELLMRPNEGKRQSL